MNDTTLREHGPGDTAGLEVFVKQPLGGMDRRAILPTLAEHGARVAREDLAAARARVRPAGVDDAAREDACVLLLGGSNGMLRAVAIQLVFGEAMPVYAVHYDSAKLQIGPHHAQALTEAAASAGVEARFRNDDATKPDVVTEVVDALRERYRVVHLVNGIAAGATKRYAEHGKALVKDLDVAFDPVRQTPDWSSWDRLRRVGLVEVDVATPQDIERTHRMMGTSTTPWADALAEAGLLVPGRSVVAFADYDFEPDDPVYGMGPLAGAKLLQREAMRAIRERHGVDTVRLCYPPLSTTAIGAIPGGLLMFAGTAELLLRAGTYRDIPTLARDTMAMFGQDARRSGELRLDAHYKAVLPEFHALSARLTNDNVRAELGHVFGGNL
jgi:enoyl-[acyl-carrier protein] reductase/trans-2-enoyl-CoA reductase (NAD+)